MPLRTLSGRKTAYADVKGKLTKEYGASFVNGLPGCNLRSCACTATLAARLPFRGVFIVCLSLPWRPWR